MAAPAKAPPRAGKYRPAPAGAKVVDLPGPPADTPKTDPEKVNLQKQVDDLRKKAADQEAASKAAEEKAKAESDRKKAVEDKLKTQKTGDDKGQGTSGPPPPAKGNDNWKWASALVAVLVIFAGLGMYLAGRKPTPPPPLGSDTAGASSVDRSQLQQDITLAVASGVKGLQGEIGRLDSRVDGIEKSVSQLRQQVVGLRGGVTIPKMPVVRTGTGTGSGPSNPYHVGCPPTRGTDSRSFWAEYQRSKRTNP